MSERQKKKLAQKEALKIKRRMIEKVRHSNVAFNLNLLVDGWLELESDPGTFSLLIEDFGCSGAQVDEIYDLEQKFDGPVLGFIFLFKWLNNNQNDRSRNNYYQQQHQQRLSTSTLANNNSTINDANYNNNNNNINNKSNGLNISHWNYVEDETIISEMFFAKQMISNSCATHALISILLNCDYKGLKLGPILTRLKEHTKIMDPENKGYAISNLPELAKAHNSHASYSSLYNCNKPSHSSTGMSYVISGNQRTNLQQQKKHEAYHFVSYVPINNRLYELDGLKNYPIDHGPYDPKEGWTEKFRAVIKERLSINKTSDDSALSNDIRYNLMAVIPDRRVFMKSKLRNMKRTRRVIDDSIERLTKRVFTPRFPEIDIPNPPYSPLSNGTLTASESGSFTNSPPRFEEDYFSEDDNNVERLFFVKFTKKDEPTIFKEENIKPAHKNCIIEREATNLIPVNLKIDNPTSDPQQLCKNDNKPTKPIPSKNTNTTSTTATRSSRRVKPSFLKEQRPENNNERTLASDDDEPSKEPLEEGEVKKEDNVRPMDMTDDQMKPYHSEPMESDEQIDGHKETEIKEDIINEVEAHNNHKYNLSSKPPFDFNILDDMQHVHYDKSTLKDMKALSARQECEIKNLQSTLKEEIDKRRKYKIDNSRRTHNYEPFIMTFLSLLAKQGNLADLIEKDLGIVSEEQQSTSANNINPAQQSSFGTPTISTTYKSPKPQTNSNPTSSYNHKSPATNGTSFGRGHHSINKTNSTPKPKYKYVSTGRPVGRPRKNPLPTDSPVKGPNSSSTK